MTLRERWTVYPLLFLALGLVMRDRVEPQTVSPQIFVQELVVVDDEGRPQYALTADGWNPSAPRSLQGGISLPDLLKSLSPNQPDSASENDDALKDQEN